MGKNVRERLRHINAILLNWKLETAIAQFDAKLTSFSQDTLPPGDIRASEQTIEETKKAIIDLVGIVYQPFFELLASMVTPHYFLEIMAYIVEQINFAFNNGKPGEISVENFHLKFAGEGSIDHHDKKPPNKKNGDDPLSDEDEQQDEEGTKKVPTVETHETYWGLYSASFMALTAKMLGVLDGLSVHKENDPDLDQILAKGIIEAQSIEDAITLLESNIYHFLREEFAIFADCDSQEEPIITEEFQEHSVNILENKDPNKPPIVIVQYNQDMLPIHEGQWNVMNRAIVKEALKKNGLEHHLKTGVVTMVIHGKKISHNDVNTIPSREGVERQIWQQLRMDRLVLGILSENNERWENQFNLLENTLVTHQELVEIITRFFPPDISRNLLLAVSRAQDDKPGKKEPYAQDALNQLMAALIDYEPEEIEFREQLHEKTGIEVPYQEKPTYGYRLIYPDGPNGAMAFETNTETGEIEEFDPQKVDVFDYLSISELEELLDKIQTSIYLAINPRIQMGRIVSLLPSEICSDQETVSFIYDTLERIYINLEQNEEDYEYLMLLFDQSNFHYETGSDLELVHFWRESSNKDPHLRFLFSRFEELKLLQRKKIVEELRSEHSSQKSKTRLLNLLSSTSRKNLDALKKGKLIPKYQRASITNMKRLRYRSIREDLMMPELQLTEKELDIVKSILT